MMGFNRRSQSPGFGSILIGSMVLAGCGLRNEPESTVNLTGIWTADVHYTEYNGESSDLWRARPLRLELGDSTPNCVIHGVPANLCTHDGSIQSLQIQASYRGESGGLAYEVRITYDNFSAEPDGRVSAQTSYVYDIDENGFEDTILRGTATLYPVTRFDNTEASGLTLLSEFNAFASSFSHLETDHFEDPSEGDKGSSLSEATANVRVAGNYAYLARFYNGLSIVDIEDPTQPVEIAWADPSEVGGAYYNDVKLFSANDRHYAVLSDAYVGLVIYDVTDPYQPTYVSTFFGDGFNLNNHTVFMVGSTAYLANYYGSNQLDPVDASGGLLIVDLTDPADPKELGRWLASSVGGTFVHDLYVENNTAYLCAWQAGFVVLDIHDPENPSVLGRYQHNRITSHSAWVTAVGGRKVAVHGEEDFGSHIRLIDVDRESLTFMQEIGAFELRPQVSVHNIMAIGNEVIAAYYQDGVRILDISDLAQPTMTAWFNSWNGLNSPSNGYSFYEGGIGVDVVDRRIFLADVTRGLLIFERE